MDDSSINTIKEKIESVRAPDHWLDRAEQPNQTSKYNAIEYCTVLFERFNRVPDVISPTIESGIYIRYRIEDWDLIIEFYNTGEIGALVNDSVRNRILDSFDLTELGINRYSKLDGWFEYMCGKGEI